MALTGIYPVLKSERRLCSIALTLSDGNTSINRGYPRRRANPRNNDRTSPDKSGYGRHELERQTSDKEEVLSSRWKFDYESTSENERAPEALRC